MLHLAINLLTIHPNLHLSLLLAPSVIPLVEHELASSWFQHVHVERASGSEDGMTSIMQRVQILPVADPSLDLDKFDVSKTSFENVTAEAMAYAKWVPEFVAPLLKGEEKVAGKFDNKFKGIEVGFCVHDVSCLCHDLLFSPSRYGCMALHLFARANREHSNPSFRT